jgi:predicted nucleotidyltransferase
MACNPSKALRWIVDILHEHQIPFQIAGGLAARVYGSTRELDDIDIDIPEESFSLIQPAIQSYIIFGPEQFKDENWDIFLMTLDYHGQKIDLGGAYKTKIFNQQAQQWEELFSDLSRARLSSVFGIEVPVISLKELIAYKTKVAREVDIADVQEIMMKIRGYACKR